MSVIGEESLELIHTRRYETRVYLRGERELVAHGWVCDTKPPGLYVKDDPEPIDIHRMKIELRVALPGLRITDARVLFESHPHASCPGVAPDYGKLVGLSIARGFTRRARELFGGPRGCTHVNALLQAMAPAIVQSTWSVTVRDAWRRGDHPGRPDPEERRRRIEANTNTCHVWAEDGEHVAALRRGERPGSPPLPVRERLRRLGRDDARWV